MGAAFILGPVFRSRCRLNPLNRLDRLSAQTGFGGNQEKSPRLSNLLISISLEHGRERVSVGHLLDTMRDRAFGALMFIFALPNILPAFPGTSIVLGAPLILLSAQLALGRSSPRLPRILRDRSVTKGDFEALVVRTVPWVFRAERLLKPRVSWLTAKPCEQVMGALCFLLAVILVLPLPLGNVLPAFAICVLSLALLERDGLAVLAGVLLGLIAIAVVSGVLYALIQSAIFLVSGVS